MIWREASTLILASANNSLVKFKWTYKLLILKRSNKSSFMPSAYVFPGGTAHQSDCDKKWENYLSQFNLQCKELPPFKMIPPILKKKSEEELSKLVSLKITAIRETFEETGILLCVFTNKKLEKEWTSKTWENLKEWRAKVQNDPSEFFNLCQFYECYPNIQSLYIWSNWLTPNDMHKRFDTAFFISFLKYQQIAAADETEIEKLNWFTPNKLIKMYNEKKIQLPPPQFYELHRLLHFQNMNNLKSFANSRTIEGCERWMPLQIKAQNGLILILPGDGAYKKLLDSLKFIKTDIISATIEEFRNKFETLHRIEYLNNFSAKLIIKNYKPSNGHFIPYIPENIDQLKN